MGKEEQGSKQSHPEVQHIQKHSSTFQVPANQLDRKQHLVTQLPGEKNRIILLPLKALSPEFLVAGDPVVTGFLFAQST